MTMNFVTFNQDYSHVAVGTSKGFKIISTDPFVKTYETKEGNIAMLEMLFSTSLVATILQPRRLQIWNTKRESIICEMTFPTTILAVRLNRKRLLIVLEEQMYLYDIQTMRLLYTIETSPNPAAICALSPSSENCYLAYPLPQKTPPSSFTPPAHAPPNSSHVMPSSGEVLIFDTVKLEAINVIEAHKSPLSCIALNTEGTLLATASDKGTIIRIFSIPDGQKLYQFRRGTMPSKIYHMSFNTTSTLLCVSSATDTIHIFKLSPQKPEEEDMGAGSSDESDIHRTSSEPSLTDTSITSAASQQTPDIGSRKPNGSFMGIIRRTSQTVGSSLANKVGGYLPKGVTEMWEPARDFAWIRLPKSPGPHANGQGNGAGSKSVRSIVAMCPNTPQAMVITSDGNFYVYDVDLSKGGEGTLVQQHSCVN